MSTVLDVVKPENVNLQALLKEVGDEVDVLIKSEQERLDAIKKKEEMEKSAAPAAPAEVKKDEGSGFQSPTPEASSPSPAPSEQPPASPEASPEQSQAESLEDMVRSLDEDMLQELMQVVQMEMESRKQQSSPAPEASASPAPSPSPSPAAPAPEQKMEMAYKKEFEAMKDKLAKSEDQAKSLEKSFSSMVDLLDKMVNKPVTKAVTDIRAVDYVDKGEKELKKNEDTANISEADLKGKLFKMSSNPKELAKLTKGERDTLSEYFINKKRTPEVLKLISK